MKELGLVEVINHNQKLAKWVRSWSVMQLVPVEIDNVVDAISSNTPNDEGEDDEYDTDKSELDDEDRERIGRIRGFDETLDDLEHYVEKTWVGPQQKTRGGGNQDSLPRSGLLISQSLLVQSSVQTSLRAST